MKDWLVGESHNNMKILAIDTSCDETSAAVTEDTKFFQISFGLRLLFMQNLEV